MRTVKLILLNLSSLCGFKVNEFIKRITVVIGRQQIAEIVGSMQIHMLPSQYSIWAILTIPNYAISFYSDNLLQKVTYTIRLC